MATTIVRSAEVERVKRIGGLLGDALSQDLLKRYLRDIEPVPDPPTRTRERGVII